MKYQCLLLGLGSLFICASLLGQTPPCPCCTEQHQAFDFWIGEWEVKDTSGTVVGYNTIEQLEAGCLLTEHWRGTSGATGRSFNYYQPADSTWNQNWMDNAGNPLILKGKPSPGKMVMRSAWQTSQTGNKYYNKVTWTANDDGSVTQKWDIIGTNEQILQVAFLGIYRKKE
ncbi:MAG: hypothetical protein AAF840_17330 [Bacteroidota bacterium]